MRQLGEMPAFLRKPLHLWFLLSRGMTLGVRGAVLGRHDDVLLVRHGYVKGWHMPGGGVEWRESSLTALKRELLEEASVRCTGEPTLHGVFFNGVASPRDHVSVYVVREFERTDLKPPGREIAEAAFFPLDRLPAETTRGTRDRLREILTGAPPAETW